MTERVAASNGREELTGGHVPSVLEAHNDLMRAIAGVQAAEVQLAEARKVCGHFRERMRLAEEVATENALARFAAAAAASGHDDCTWPDCLHHDHHQALPVKPTWCDECSTAPAASGRVTATSDDGERTVGVRREPAASSDLPLSAPWGSDKGDESGG